MINSANVAGIQASAFQVDPTDVVAAVNSTVVLPCTPPYSQPTPSIHWTRNGVDLNETEPRITVLPTGNLYITDVQLDDAGDYQCIAHNDVTGARRRSAVASLTTVSCKFNISHSILIL